MLVVQNLIQEYRWGPGSLVGHPYLTSLWLGSPICDVLAPKRVLRRSLALFCLLPGYKLWILVNKRVKWSLCYLHTHFCVWRWSMLYKAFCLVFHGPHSNNCEHIFKKDDWQIRVGFNILSRPESSYKLKINFSFSFFIIKQNFVKRSGRENVEKIVPIKTVLFLFWISFQIGNKSF